MKLIPFFVFPLLASSQSLREGIKIRRISHFGPGCPTGSFSSFLSPDAQFLTFSFGKFSAYIGPSYDPTVKTRLCGVHIELELPNNHTQYALVENVYHGYERLEKDITVTFYSSFYASSDAQESTNTHVSIQGSGVGQVFTRSVEVPEAQYVWSKCGGISTLWNANERAALTSSVKSAEGSFGAEEGLPPMTRQLRFIYRECS